MTTPNGVNVPLYIVVAAFALLIGLVGLAAFLGGIAFEGGQPEAAPPPTATVMAPEQPTEPPEQSPTATPTPLPTSTRVPTATLLPTPVPTRTPLPKTGDICGRHPAVQNAILRTIGSSRCEGVSNAELFRILEFSISTGNTIPLQPGDFDGLVNLQRLTLSSEAPIPLGAFSGLSVERMTLTANDIEPGVFFGADVQRLYLSGGEFLPGPGVLPHSLTELKLHYSSYGRSSEREKLIINKDFLDGLSNLEWLEVDFSHSGAGGGEVAVHKDSLSVTPKLRGLRLLGYSITAERDFIAGLSQLESLRLTSLHVKTIIQGEPILTLHPQSPLYGSHSFYPEVLYDDSFHVNLNQREWGGEE